MHVSDCHACCHAAQVHELDVFYFLLSESIYVVPLAWYCACVWWYFDLCGTGKQDSRSFIPRKGNEDGLMEEQSYVSVVSSLDRTTARRRKTR